MIIRTYIAQLTLILTVLLLAACDSGFSPEQKIKTARSLMPVDPVVAEIYQRTCRNCHTVEATGAPLTGDKSAWADLIGQSSKAQLVENVINGKGGMPPFGLCMECGIDEISALIDFMAQQ
jgi:cytochrome c5